MKGNISYFDCYHVTREGNVYSKYRDRVTWRKMAKRKKNNGYLIVSLRNNKGIKYTFNIHRLVALIYIPNPDNKPCVGHKDNNRENNKVENLYWCTNQENTQQCIRDGRFNIPSPKLSEESINKMIEDYESGMSNLQIKVKYGISIMTMYKYFSERGVIWKKGKR